MVHALGLEPANQDEQLGRLLTGEIPCRFVKDEEPGAARRGASGGHQLLLPDRQIGQQGRRRQFETEIVQDLLRFAHHLPMLKEPKTHFFIAQEQICGDGKMRTQHDFLVYRVDAVIDRFVRRGERDRLAFPKHFTAGAHMDAGEQLDQGGFAGAVLADDRVDFACLKGQIDGFQRVGGAESFVEFLEHQKRRAAGHRACFRITPTLLRLVHRQLLVWEGKRFSDQACYLISELRF